MKVSLASAMKNRALAWLLVALVINSGYIAAFADPTLFYMGNVLLHLVLGLVVTAGAIAMWRKTAGMRRLGLLFFSAASGITLAIIGNTIPHRYLLVFHIAVSVIFVAVIAPWLWNVSAASVRRGFAIAAAVLILLPPSALLYRKAFPNPSDKIVNPLIVPASMAEEGGGPKTPFWPSSSRTNVGGTIPSNFFMDSAVCGECHKDIYNQWQSSTHHFASFNNQFYRKAVEYMQDVQGGTHGSKWCAGCHDHAVFFNGRFEKPIKPQINTPEAQNGLGCVSCHSIVHVDSTMGNGGFTLEYPPLHDLASSKNPYIRMADSFLTYLNPAPHRNVFMKPFIREQAAEFCSTCHKVHLDVPVNNYRWIRGFNDYDNWQASGVSGQGARSFYYPQTSSTCADCHMPKIRSNDPGNRDGFVHSHRFAAANMAVAYANQDKTQMNEVEKMLKSGFITVDIFAASPVEQSKGQAEMRRRASEGPQLASTFAVGEEAETSGQVLIREVDKVAAPIDAGYTFRPGDNVRVDVVVRTRKIGHFFPGGTVDSFDVWLELEGKDATGKPVFWSGRVEDNGKGPVEPGAHFYKSYLLDAEGNPINKRNGWAARSVLYVRLIPPGAADVAHYRVQIPKGAKGPITLTAKLNYRKFEYDYTQFAYAGEPAPNQDPSLVSVHYDSRKFTYGRQNLPKNVSGKVKDRIPDLPVVTLAKDEKQLPLGGPTNYQPQLRKTDRERWNDWGIGLLLQGDLKGAEYAFTKVTEIEPGYADGWINVARALIQEGETDRAKPFLERALQIDNSLGRAHFFKAMVQKADGDYDGALTSLSVVASKYPRDRVVLNQIGRIRFLKKDYAGAVDALKQVLLVDPEDVQGHYTLMLAYRGLGDTASAAREQKLFQRFKADEASEAITATRRMLSPEDNNERQRIHDHESVPLTAQPPVKPKLPTRQHSQKTVVAEAR